MTDYPDFKPASIDDLESGLPFNGSVWAAGYTQSELDAAQEKFCLKFLPDLINLFLDRRPVRGWDWRYDIKGICDVLNWPLEGLRFELRITTSGYVSGGNADGYGRTIRSSIGFSQNSSKIGSPGRTQIHSGRTARYWKHGLFHLPVRHHLLWLGLGDYFEREFSSKPQPASKPSKHIRFWSDLVESERC